MEFREVRSSSLRSVGYDVQTQDLEITFCSGGVYRFFKVPKEKADGLINSKSPGLYFIEEIKAYYQFKCTQRAPSKKREPNASETKQRTEPQESKSVRQRRAAQQSRKIQPI